MREVSITDKQRKKFVRKGNRMVKDKTITGYQLEDHPTNKKARVEYGHDDHAHTARIRKRAPSTGTRKYPRESYYKWDPSWKPGPGTELVDNRQFAKEKGHNLVIKGDTKKSGSWLKKNAVNRPNQKSVKGSWDVPDVRIVNTQRKHDGYKTAYQVTRKIDRNSRFSTLVARKKDVPKVRKALKYERVHKIQVQNYPSSKHKGMRTLHSFWKFISGG